MTKPTWIRAAFASCMVAGMALVCGAQSSSSPSAQVGLSPTGSASAGLEPIRGSASGVTLIHPSVSGASEGEKSTDASTPSDLPAGTAKSKRAAATAAAAGRVRRPEGAAKTVMCFVPGVGWKTISTPTATNQIVKASGSQSGDAVAQPTNTLRIAVDPCSSLLGSQEMQKAEAASASTGVPANAGNPASNGKTATTTSSLANSDAMASSKGKISATAGVLSPGTSESSLSSSLAPIPGDIALQPGSVASTAGGDAVSQQRKAGRHFGENGNSLSPFGDKSISGTPDISGPPSSKELAAYNRLIDGCRQLQTTGHIDRQQLTMAGVEDMQKICTEIHGKSRRAVIAKMRKSERYANAGRM